MGAAVDVERFAADFQRWLADHDDELAPFRCEPVGSLEEAFEDARQLQRMLYDAGWSRWGWPEACGGLGGSPILRNCVHDELAAAGCVLPEALQFPEIIGPTLIHFAPELAGRHIPPMLRGDERWCQGFSEPDAGSDLASLRTRAADEGAHFRLTGQKQWMSFGQMSHWCMLLARTGSSESRHRGLSMLWVDMASPGVTVHPQLCSSGRNEVAEVFFDDVEVPRDHLVGPLDEGWRVAMYLLQFERGNFAWQRQAWLHAALRASVADIAVSSTSAASALGGAYLSLLALRSRSRATVQRLAAGEAPGPEISVDKILLSEAEQAVLDTARQLRIGGFLLGDDTTSMSLRARWSFSRIVSIYGGAKEVQYDIVAERILGLHGGR